MAKQRTFKVKRKVSQVRGAYLKWDEWREGDMIVGRYDQRGEDSYGKPMWCLGEVFSCSLVRKPKFAASLIGKAFNCNSAGQLDSCFVTKEGEEKIKIGEIVQIEYLGKKEITKGPYTGKESHQFDVQVMSDEDEADETNEDTASDTNDYGSENDEDDQYDVL